MDDSVYANRVKWDFSRLRATIGNLPPPQFVYDQIICACERLRSLTLALPSIGTRITRLRVPLLSWQERSETHQTLTLTAENLRLKFLLVRTELRSLWQIPPLLFATDSIRPFVWHAMWNRPHYDDDGQPLTLNSDEIEEIISDSLDTLDDYLATLQDIGEELLEHQGAYELSCRDYVFRNLSDITHLLHHAVPKHSHKCTRKAARAAPNYWQPASRKREREGDDDDADDKKKRRKQNEDEQRTISRNADYMEPINSLETEEGEEMEPEEMLVMVDESGEDDEGEEIQSAQPQEDDEVVILRDDEVEGSAPPEEDDDDASSPGRDDAMETERLQEELQRTVQAKLGLETMLEEVRFEKVCQPRRFDRGRINSKEEETMPCIFCGAIGVHYSDSCGVHRETLDRVEILRRQRRCLTCLQRRCQGGKMCKKSGTRCRHCKKLGHSPTICDLPERSQVIMERRDILQRAYNETIDIINDLRRKLRDRGVGRVEQR